MGRINHCDKLLLLFELALSVNIDAVKSTSPRNFLFLEWIFFFIASTLPKKSDFSENPHCNSDKPEAWNFSKQTSKAWIDRLLRIRIFVQISQISESPNYFHSEYKEPLLRQNNRVLNFRGRYRLWLATAAFFSFFSTFAILKRFRCFCWER